MFLCARARDCIRAGGVMRANICMYMSYGNVPTKFEPNFFPYLINVIMVTIMIIILIHIRDDFFHKIKCILDSLIILHCTCITCIELRCIGLHLNLVSGIEISSLTTNAAFVQYKLYNYIRIYSC